MVHRNTQLHINGNEVERWLGPNTHVYPLCYTVDYFPNYAKIHQQASPSIIIP
jgi:hypothetical protein